jgi:NifU-like protein involved in Fe-S cluster formation
LRIDPSGRIERARFQAFGCLIAIAVASAAVARLEGASIAEALAPGRTISREPRHAEQARLAGPARGAARRACHSPAIAMSPK